MNIRVHLQGMVCLICGLVLLSGLVGAQKGEAGTYYVATEGSDSNPGTEKQPFQTLDRGVRDLGPRDTLYVKNGTYTGGRQLAHIPSGTSWDNPVTIAAYPGHSPVIVKSEQDYNTLYFTNNRYIVIDGFFIDGTDALDAIKITSESSGIANHIRIQNSEIAYAVGDGIFVTSGSDGNEFIHLQVHDNGSSEIAGYGFYIRSSDNIIEDCSIHNNYGWGIHLWSGSDGINNNIIRNNEIYDNGESVSKGGIIITSGSGNQAYDNVIWGNIGGIRIDHGAANTQVGGNTIYENAEYGIYIGTGSSNAFIDSNSIHDNNGPSIINHGISTKILP